MHSNDQANPPILVRHRRVRHAWSEASNPHDLLAARAGWGTAALILLVMAWLVAKKAGWI
jgi:hypothetical protein